MHLCQYENFTTFDIGILSYLKKIIKLHACISWNNSDHFPLHYVAIRYKVFSNPFPYQYCFLKLIISHNQGKRFKDEVQEHNTTLICVLPPGKRTVYCDTVSWCISITAPPASSNFSEVFRLTLSDTRLFSYHVAYNICHVGNFCTTNTTIPIYLFYLLVCNFFLSWNFMPLNMSMLLCLWI